MADTDPTSTPSPDEPDPAQLTSALSGSTGDAVKSDPIEPTLRAKEITQPSAKATVGDPTASSTRSSLGGSMPVSDAFTVGDDGTTPVLDDDARASAVPLMNGVLSQPPTSTTPPPSPTAPAPETPFHLDDEALATIRPMIDGVLAKPSAMATAPPSPTAPAPSATPPTQITGPSLLPSSSVPQTTTHRPRTSPAPARAISQPQALPTSTPAAWRGRSLSFRPAGFEILDFPRPRIGTGPTTSAAILMNPDGVLVPDVATGVDLLGPAITVAKHNDRVTLGLPRTASGKGPCDCQVWVSIECEIHLVASTIPPSNPELARQAWAAWGPNPKRVSAPFPDDALDLPECPDPQIQWLPDEVDFRVRQELWKLALADRRRQNGTFDAPLLKAVFEVAVLCRMSIVVIYPDCREVSYKACLGRVYRVDRHQFPSHFGLDAFGGTPVPSAHEFGLNHDDFHSPDCSINSFVLLRDGDSFPLAGVPVGAEFSAWDGPGPKAERGPDGGIRLNWSLPEDLPEDCECTYRIRPAADPVFTFVDQNGEPACDLQAQLYSVAVLGSSAWQSAIGGRYGRFTNWFRNHFVTDRWGANYPWPLPNPCQGWAGASVRQGADVSAPILRDVDSILPGLIRSYLEAECPGVTLPYAFAVRFRFEIELRCPPKVERKTIAFRYLVDLKGEKPEREPIRSEDPAAEDPCANALDPALQTMVELLRTVVQNADDLRNEVDNPGSEVDRAIDALGLDAENRDRLISKLQSLLPCLWVEGWKETPVGKLFNELVTKPQHEPPQNPDLGTILDVLPQAILPVLQELDELLRGCDSIRKALGWIIGKGGSATDKDISEAKLSEKLAAMAMAVAAEGPGALDCLGEGVADITAEAVQDAQLAIAVILGYLRHAAGSLLEWAASELSKPLGLIQGVIDWLLGFGERPDPDARPDDDRMEGDHGDDLIEAPGALDTIVGLILLLVILTWAAGGLWRRRHKEFVGKLRGQLVEFGISVRNRRMTKVSPQAKQRLRREFDSRGRKAYLQRLARDEEAIATLKRAGLTDDDIERMKNGRPPTGYDVHHKTPLDLGGTNDPANLILVKQDPYHRALTNYQNEVARGMQPGDTRDIDWPEMAGIVYPPGS